MEFGATWFHGTVNNPVYDYAVQQGILHDPKWTALNPDLDPFKNPFKQSTSTEAKAALKIAGALPAQPAAAAAAAETLAARPHESAAAAAEPGDSSSSGPVGTADAREGAPNASTAAAAAGGGGSGGGEGTTGHLRTHSTPRQGVALTAAAAKAAGAAEGAAPAAATAAAAGEAAYSSNPDAAAPPEGQWGIELLRPHQQQVLAGFDRAAVLAGMAAYGEVVGGLGEEGEDQTLGFETRQLVNDSNSSVGDGSIGDALRAKFSDLVAQSQDKEAGVGGSSTTAVAAQAVAEEAAVEGVAAVAENAVTAVAEGAAAAATINDAAVAEILGTAEGKEGPAVAAAGGQGDEQGEEEEELSEEELVEQLSDEKFTTSFCDGWACRWVLHGSEDMYS